MARLVGSRWQRIYPAGFHHQTDVFDNPINTFSFIRGNATDPQENLQKLNDLSKIYILHSQQVPCLQQITRAKHASSCQLITFSNHIISDHILSRRQITIVSSGQKQAEHFRVRKNSSDFLQADSNKSVHEPRAKRKITPNFTRTRTLSIPAQPEYS